MTATPPRVRWLAGAVGLGLAGAAVLAGTAVGATSGDDVSAVFSVTGVSTSNCPVSTGGADVYIKPGAELDATSSAVGVTLLGQQLSSGSLLGFDGKLTIDPKTSGQKVYSLDTKTVTKIVGLSTGNHTFTWDASVTLLGQVFNAVNGLKAVGAGAALDYKGTIHVTPDAPNCGVAVQVPGPSVSVSITKLPPIQISVPPVNVSVPVDPGKILSSLPLPTKKPSAPVSSPSFSYTPPPPTVPEQVVPTGHGGVFPGNTGGGYFGGSLPGVRTTTTPGTTVAPSTPTPSASTSSAPVDKAAAAKEKAAKLASAKAPSAQLPIVLAILAVIALAIVTATYARLYLLRRSS